MGFGVLWILSQNNGTWKHTLNRALTTLPTLIKMFQHFVSYLSNFTCPMKHFWEIFPPGASAGGWARRLQEQGKRSSSDAIKPTLSTRVQWYLLVWRLRHTNYISVIPNCWNACFKPFAWTSLTWELALGIFLCDSFAWDSSIGNCTMRSSARNCQIWACWRSLGISLALELRLVSSGLLIFARELWISILGTWLECRA